MVVDIILFVILAALCLVEGLSNVFDKRYGFAVLHLTAYVASLGTAGYETYSVVARL